MGNFHQFSQPATESSHVVPQGPISLRGTILWRSMDRSGRGEAVKSCSAYRKFGQDPTYKLKMSAQKTKISSHKFWLSVFVIWKLLLAVSLTLLFSLPFVFSYCMISLSRYQLSICSFHFLDLSNIYFDIIYVRCVLFSQLS